MTLGLLSICVSLYLTGFPFPHRVPSQAQASFVLPSFATGLTSISHRTRSCQVLCKQNMHQENAHLQGLQGARPATSVIPPTMMPSPSQGCKPHIPPTAPGPSAHHCPGCQGLPASLGFTGLCLRGRDPHRFEEANNHKSGMDVV